MSSFEQNVQQGLRDLAAELAPGADERVIARVRHSTRRRRRGAGAAMGIGAAAAVAAIAVVATFGGPNSSSGETPVVADGSAQTPLGPGDSILLVQKLGDPCPGATHAATLTGILRLTGVPIYPPSQGQLTDAWTCGDTPVLMYGDIQISYEQGWGDIDAQQKWAALARDYGGRIETVLGRPAYVHPPTVEGTRSGVMVVVNGTLIRILAEGDVPVERLISLADTIQVK